GSRTGRGRRWAAAGAGLGAGAALALHAAPALASIGVVRRTFAPRLAGLGAPDHVALTFDDGPDPASTPAFLRTLDELGWRATFFMLGEMVRKAPGLAAEVAAAGHEVAVHGDGHVSMLRRLPRGARDDIARGLDAVAHATGVEPRWFRPPYGTLSAGSLLAASELGLETVLWTAWGRDWRPEATPATVVHDVLQGRVAGGTVLLHDSDCTSSPDSWHSTLGALPLLAEAFAPRRLRTGPVGEHQLVA
ncbi:MAG: polysaccharide deacetylase family protein, partial [Actinobacteria bacterium]|nr:polysaccharide deacetylase family protein [Actinomycetota bacterium]